MNQTLPPTSSSLVAGKYQLVRRIGQGGMGSVWEGRHASLGTTVAIKFIENDYADNADARTRFDREARAAASIQSKHAIQIFDHGVTEDGKPYIVMEMLKGEPLDKRLQRLHRLPLADAARILQQVGRALAQAHEKGIVHRDLKPENIFLVTSPDDDEEIAKVLDFGIAKVQPSSGSPGLTSSTKTGAVLGTPYYMSPEQARGLRNVDHRTDVWSIGVIAFRAVTGRLPFEGESVGDLLVKICTSPLPVPSQVAPELPPAFDAWFITALERDPQRRFSTMAEAIDGLAFAAGITVRRGNAGTPATPFMPVGAAAMGVAPTLSPDSVVAAGGTSAPFTANALDHESRELVRGPSGLLIAGVAAAVLALGLGAGGLTLFARSRASAAQSSVGVVASPQPPASAAAPLPTMEPLAPSSATASAALAAPAASVATPGKPTFAPGPSTAPGKPGKPGKPTPSTAPSAPPPPAVSPPPPPPPQPAPQPPPPPPQVKPKHDQPGY
ncbi:MAG: serine/threonine protein kinase [Myxococcales bacterium]|nr:serine/threonine protein kinase [Myxococcales bacterium]